MKQELGETVDAIMKDDFLEVEKILSARKGNYWILIHHKPTQHTLSTGQKIIKKLIKAYDTKPQCLIGTMVLEVKEGSISGIDVHPHDAPINWGLIEPVAGFDAHPLIQKNKIAKEYFYN